MARAGQPQMRSLPASHLAYEQQLRSAMPLARWFQPATATQAAGPWHAATIQLVEIDALLAYQFTVDTDRTTGHCGGLSSPPTLDELLAACLPTSWTTGPTPMSQQKTEPGPGLPPVNQSFVLKSRTLNFRILEQGAIPTARYRRDADRCASGARPSSRAGSEIQQPLLFTQRFSPRCRCSIPWSYGNSLPCVRYTKRYSGRYTGRGDVSANFAGIGQPADCGSLHAGAGASSKVEGYDTNTADPLG